VSTYKEIKKSNPDLAKLESNAVFVNPVEADWHRVNHFTIVNVCKSVKQ